VKANSRPSSYVRLLISAGEPRFLVSAYDIASSDVGEAIAIKEALRAAKSADVSVLLDSGNYESYWKTDPDWTARRFASVLASTSAPLAFHFDNQHPPPDQRDAADEIVAAVGRDQGPASNITVCPIIHGVPGSLATIVRVVAERLQPVILAVAERELGEGILARARTLRRVRSAIDEVAPTTVLHVLGTGSPIALLVYAMAGAQSFDGLEWCHTCVDPDTARLHHFQHRDLVRTLEPKIVLGLPYLEGTLVHNLLFFRTWLARIREALASGTEAALLGSVLPMTRRDSVLTALRTW
jgi:queuine/archaeosine tRNA-ribosyltransferase